MSRRTPTDSVHRLDQVLPLAGAKHADVVRYAVDIPMRYAECFATLADGRSVRLADARQLLGRTGNECDCLLLFSVGERYLLLSAETGRVEELDAEEVPRRRFIARDGSLLDFHKAADAQQPTRAQLPARGLPAFAGASLQAIH